MEKLMEQLWEFFGRGENVGPEIRLFRLVTLSISLICLFGVLPTNLLQDLNPFLNIIVAIYGIASVCLFAASWTGRHLIRSYYVIGIAVINACWFLNGGSDGSIDYFFFPLLLYPLFFFRGMVRLLAVFVLSVDNGLLLLLEKGNPSWITPYHSASDRVLDLATGFSFSSIFCAIIFLIVVTAFERELQERKQVEASLLILNKELDLRVRERTARLQASLKEQESFSYSVSHDLRAHLRHINSYLSILSEDFGAELPSEAGALLTRSCTASRRMGDLIDDLLALSKVSRADLSRGIVDLSELADWVCKRLSELEPGRRVEVVVAPNQTAHGDKTLLLQVLENLLGNAWKYTSATAAATIAFGSTELENRQVFYVRDNGAGFDMTYRDALFEPFRRLHGAEFEGNGVGLTTVKRIIERHGGEVWAEGAVGTGATFFFTLPAT